MNFNKFTKDQLINKLKRLENKNESNQNTIIPQIKSYFSQIWELILTFKTILMKLTLISLLINIFKKYKLFRRLWIIFNSIIMSIFGLNVIDGLGISWISNFVREVKFILSNIVDYFINTSMYKNLFGLLSEDKPIENKTINSKTIEIDTKETRAKSPIWVENMLKEKPSGSDWLKPTEVNSEVIEETNNLKYYIIGGVLIIVSGLTWYYFPEIKDGFFSAWEWFSSNPRRPDGTGGGETSNQNNIRSNNSESISQNLRVDNQGNIIIPQSELATIQEKIQSGVGIPKAPETLPEPIEIELDNAKEKYFHALDKGKGRVLSPSASLENLNEQASQSWQSPTEDNISVSSSSSGSTIRPISIENIEKPELKEAIASSSKLQTSDSLNIQSKLGTGRNLSDNVIFSYIDNHWKEIIDSRVKESMDFIENHMPTNELDETDYIKESLKRIKELNINFLEETKFNIQENKIDLNQIKISKGVISKTELWIEDIEEKIKEWER